MTTIRLATGVGPPEAFEKGLRPVVRLAHTPGAQGDNCLKGAKGVEQIPEESKPALLVSYVYLKPFLRGSSQTDEAVEVPEGHYAEESMKATVVPNRNMLMLAAATAVAVAEKVGYVAYGAHAGDHAIYPDCREEFAASMAEAMALCDWHSVRLLRPFVGLTKSEIVKRGADLGVPFSLTWSCYQGRAYHCGRCGTCVERIEAFEVAGVVDPTEYEGRL